MRVLNLEIHSKMIPVSFDYLRGFVAGHLVYLHPPQEGHGKL